VAGRSAAGGCVAGGSTAGGSVVDGSVAGGSTAGGSVVGGSVVWARPWGIVGLRQSSSFDRAAYSLSLISSAWTISVTIKSSGVSSRIP